MSLPCIQVTGFFFFSSTVHMYVKKTECKTAEQLDERSHNYMLQCALILKEIQCQVFLKVKPTQRSL